MRPPFSLVFTAAILGLAACAEDALEQDNDGDGFLAADDCNDDDPAVNPAAS